MSKIMQLLTFFIYKVLHIIVVYCTYIYRNYCVDENNFYQEMFHQNGQPYLNCCTVGNKGCATVRATLIAAAVASQLNSNTYYYTVFPLVKEFEETKKA